MATDDGWTTFESPPTGVLAIPTVEPPPTPPVEPREFLGMTSKTWAIVAGCIIPVAVIVGTVDLVNDDEVKRARPTETLDAKLRHECGRRLSMCGIEFDEFGTTQTITLLPDAPNSGASVLARWAVETGCVDEGDFARMDQTRALDGKVGSRNGRSTWTVHPDDGLTIVCDT